MRRTAGLFTLFTLGALAVGAAPAVAAPPGNGLIIDGGYDCNGVETTIVHSAGHSAYIGDQHYTVASFSFMLPGGETFTQTFGNKKGLSGALSCSQESPDGLFTVVLLPVPPAG